MIVEAIIKWAVPFICGVTITAVITLFKKTKALSNGVQCLLRADILSQYEKWCDRGYCPIYAKEALTKEYNAYHTLGGNDVATDLYKQVMLLPSEKHSKT